MKDVGRLAQGREGQREGSKELGEGRRARGEGGGGGA